MAISKLLQRVSDEVDSAPVPVTLVEVQAPFEKLLGFLRRTMFNNEGKAPQDLRLMAAILQFFANTEAVSK